MIQQVDRMGDPYLFDLVEADVDFSIWEKEVYGTQPIEPEQPGTPKRILAALGAATIIAGFVGYEAGRPDEELQLSADQITEDLNSGDRTTEPVIIEQGSELVIPKEQPTDVPISVVNPIRLSDDTYGALIFDDDGKAKVVEIPSDASLKPVETTTDEEVETNEIVYPISVVYTEVATKNGEAERVYSAVAGDDSGNAANAVKIDTAQASPEQKRLLKDKALKKLVKDAVGLTAQDRVGYLDIED